MKEPEKPKKPERKPEKGMATCECGCCPEHGEEAQIGPFPGHNPPEGEVDWEKTGEAAEELLQKLDKRRENARGKAICGKCQFRVAGAWRCVDNFQCPTPQDVCSVFKEKPRKPRPSQAKPERVVIPAGVRFLYLGRPRQGERHQGVMTVAYSVCEKAHAIEFGFSFCSPEDQWVKAKGQDLAIQRLKFFPTSIRYLYEPRRLAVQVAQAFMEHRFDALASVLSQWESLTKVPSWTKDLAQRLQTRKVSGISRLKLFERRSFTRPVSPVLLDLVDRMMAEGSPVIHSIRTARSGPDQIMARMLADILNLGGKP